MSDLNERDENEIVDLDTCSRKKALLLGVLVTAALGMVGYSYLLVCIHFVVGGLAAVGFFTKTHRITVSYFTGVKLGVLAAFLGMLINYGIFLAVWIPNSGEEQLGELKEEVIKTFYESGRPEFAEQVEQMAIADISQTLLMALIILGTIASVVMGALGGGLGATLFKKGPLAQ